MSVCTGNVNTCLGHFASHFKTAGTLTKEQMLQKFTGAKENTVREWLAGRSRPVGQFLVALRYFLDLVGYKVHDVEDLSPVVRTLGRILAYRLKTLEEIADAVGYTAPLRRDQMLLVLHGGGMVPPRVQQAERFGASMREAIEAKTVELRTELGLASHGTVVCEKPPSEAVTSADDGKRGANSVDHMLRAAAVHITSLSSIASFLLSTEVSAEERARLHTLVGSDGVLALISRLSGLCSETARRKSHSGRKA